MRKNTAADFWAQVDRTDGCWLWKGSVLQGRGYGQFKMAGKNRLVHRLAYELAVGPIPDALPLDHLCRVRICVRPDHLEPVTTAENNRRRDAAITHCPQGHEYTPENARRYGTPPRLHCRPCTVAWKRSYRLRKKAERMSPSTVLPDQRSTR